MGIKKVDMAEKMQDEASEWSMREDASYRMYKTTDLEWEAHISKDAYQTEFEIANTWVAAAPNGGSIAAMGRKGAFTSSDYLLTRHIAIFEGSGKLSAKILVNLPLHKIET